MCVRTFPAVVLFHFEYEETGKGSFLSGVPSWVQEEWKAGFGRTALLGTLWPCSPSLPHPSQRSREEGNPTETVGTHVTSIVLGTSPVFLGSSTTITRGRQGLEAWKIRPWTVPLSTLSPEGTTVLSVTGAVGGTEAERPCTLWFPGSWAWSVSSPGAVFLLGTFVKPSSD